MNTQKIFVPHEICVGNSKHKSETGVSMISYIKPSGVIDGVKSFDAVTGVSVVENVPTSGFSLIEKVDDDCKTTVRIKHPKGFVFKVSVENLFDILMTSGIEKGILQGSFAFAWKDHCLYLVSELADSYKSSLKEVKVLYKADKFKASKLAVGDVLEIKKHAKKSLIGGEYVYAGVFDLVPEKSFEAADLSEISFVNGEYVWKPKTSKVHVFFNHQKRAGFNSYVGSSYITLKKIDDDSFIHLGNLNTISENVDEKKSIEGYRSYNNLRDIETLLKRGDILKSFSKATPQDVKVGFSHNKFLPSMSKGLFISKDLKSLYSIDWKKDGAKKIFSCLPVTIEDVLSGNIEHKEYSRNALNGLSLMYGMGVEKVYKIFRVK